MKLTNGLNKRFDRRDRIEAKAQAQAETARKSIENDRICPECNKEMQPTTAGDKLAMACFGCRICFPRNPA